MPSQLHSGVKIKVENQTLIVRGHPDESAGCVLRGCVVMYQRERTRLKSLRLHLIGQLKVQWTDRIHLNRWSAHSLSATGALGSPHHQRQFKTTLIILNRECVLLDPSREKHTIEPGTYVYPFEFVVPGHLPETIQYSPAGSVNYKLKAVAERPALFQTNWSDQLGLALVRHLTEPVPNSPIIISSAWAERLSYEIVMPTRIHRRGDTVRIACNFKPHTPGDLQVRHLTCTLKEYTTFRTNDNVLRTKSHAVRTVRDTHFPSYGTVWQKVEALDIPQSIQNVQCDIENSLFRIEHKVQLSMSLISAEKCLLEFRAYLPIVLVQDDLTTTYTETDFMLPGYEDARHMPPYVPARAMHLDSSTRFDSSSWLETGDEACSPYSTTDPPYPTRLPSYHTTEGTPSSTSRMSLHEGIEIQV